MKIELIDAGPVRKALEELKQLEQIPAGQDAKNAYAHARLTLETALDNAANPQFADGYDTDALGRIWGVSRDGAVKRIKRQKLDEKGLAFKQNGEWRVRLDKAS